MTLYRAIWGINPKPLFQDPDIKQAVFFEQPVVFSKIFWSTVFLLFKDWLARFLLPDIFSLADDIIQAICTSFIATHFGGINANVW